MKHTPENIVELGENEIFVFGSNMNGNHLGGAARLAYDQWGAEWGIGEGPTGQCYAFPTLSETMERRTISELQRSIDRFFSHCHEQKEKIFLLTKVGCGIAGYEEDLMKRITAGGPINIIKPKGW